VSASTRNSGRSGHPRWSHGSKLMLMGPRRSATPRTIRRGSSRSP
jgi:hypothetical protein